MIDRLEALRRRLQTMLGRHPLLSRALHDDESSRSTGPGLLLVQIDGLGFEAMQRARRAGSMPNLAALTDSEPYELTPVYAGVPSSTPAFQAELFYGRRTAVPAYSFVHRATDRVFRMSDRQAAATIEAELDGRGLLVGGSSYGNIYHGGASVARFSIASLGWGDLARASRPRALPMAALTLSVDLARTVALSVLELVHGVPELVRAVRSGESWRNEVHILQARVGVAVVLREVLATLASIDLIRGLPVIHLDLLGYDEWAHRRGPDSSEADRALRGIDRMLGRLARTARRSHQRHYDIWVFSDHGQETTTPYVKRHGRSAAEAIGEVLRKHGIDHQDVLEPVRGVQGQRVAMLGARLAEALVPGLEMRQPCHNPTRAVTTALGPLGHIYLPGTLGTGELHAIAADLVADDVAPLVLTAAGDDAAWAWTRAGRLRLPDDRDVVFGHDHPYLDEVADDLVRVCHHRNAGELVISGWSIHDQPLSFSHEHGSHAGPGPHETSAFLWAPADTPINPSSAAPSASDLRDAALSVLEGSAHRPSARWSRPSDAALLRVLTYNVHGCVGLDGILSVERVARVIARYQPDVIALQELDMGRARSGWVDQAEMIAETLGLAMELHPTFQHEGEQFGDAVLSRLPMQLVRTGRLPNLPGRTDHEPRGVIWIDVCVGGQTLHILNTHLSVYPRERRLQAEVLMSSDWVGGAPIDNLVLCGDFNAGPRLPTCRTIGRVLHDVQVGLDGHRPRRTWGGRYRVARIDHIFLGPGLDAVHVDVPVNHLTRTASDHFPLLADIRCRP
jgi:endonuclease/exonuclease/phosphatase family metal-dependent hydrolase